MKMYWQVKITCTGKSYKASDEYVMFDTIENTFATLDEVKTYLKEQYGNCGRVKMYRDNPTGEVYQSGWIYCFNNADMSHLPVQKWRQQDWVEIYHIESTGANI